VTIERTKLLHSAIVAAFAFAAALVPTPARAQDRPDFDHLAKATASAINKIAGKGAPDDTVVLVSVFSETPGFPSQLGIELTKDFDAALRNHAQKFHVASADDLKALAANRNLPQSVLSDSLALKCSSSDLGLSAMVEGFIDYGPKGPAVKVVVEQLPSNHEIFHESQAFTVSGSMGQLKSRHAPSPPPLEEKKVWVSPDHPPASADDAAKPKLASGAGHMPECIYCPSAGYPEQASQARAQGEVVLMVEVSDDGFPSRISLTKGLPCGLTEQAFKAVERWRFKPPTDADGNPIASTTLIEVSFRMY
jgi:TonB family protein